MNMKTDKAFLSEEFMQCVTGYSSHEFLKMNTSNSDCEPNNSALNNDSGYLTNYNHESHSYSTSSSGLSSEDLYPQRPIEPVQNNIFFCENAVFDEPHLEGPPILLEDISIDLNNILQSETQHSILVPTINSKQNEEIAVNIQSCSREVLNLSGSNNDEFVVPRNINLPEVYMENSCLSNKSVSNKLKNSVEKISPINDSPKYVFNTSESETSFSSQANEYPFDQLRINAQEITNINNTTISSVSSNSSLTDNANKLQSINPVTPNKPIINKNDISPELFSEDECVEDEILPLSNITVSLEVLSQTQKPIVQNEHLLRNDRKLLRRVQENISGVPPPPSVTIIQTTVADMLSKIHNNKHLFLTDIFSDNQEKTENNIETEKQSSKSLLITNTKEDISEIDWPEIVNYRYHGLHHNRTKVSEDFEFYCTKYQLRFVGVETASSCTVWSTNIPGSAKKRNARLRWGAKSPGRRLSHLAKRRITFSSSNLQANCSTAMSVIGSSSLASRQLVIDARKSSALSKRKSPWKKSPRKSPQKRIKTPSSSAKKSSSRRLFAEEPQAGTSRVVSTKRALFQSPDHNRSTTSSSSSKRTFFMSPHKNSPSKIKNSPLKLTCDKNIGGSSSKPRRNLFLSPKKQSPAKNNCDKKRKRIDEPIHPSKFPRSLSFDNNATQSSAGSLSMQRRHSELSINSVSSVKSELSDLHKKKLLWAVSEALRSQQIGMSHPKFRTFAPILCKIVKNLMPDLLSNGLRQPGSTSDRMLRIARQHVFSVTRGKTFEEIIRHVKESEENNKNLKPIGYVPPESFKSEEKIKNVLQDKVLNIENQKNLKSPDKSAVRDINNKARIKRQILFDDVDSTKSLNTNR